MVKSLFTVAVAMEAADREKELDHMWYPGIEAGVEGVRWVENCVRSADKGAVWLDYQ
ncbi:hypothetical protein [Bacillus inaquosorum]|uniref:hypothetical protein n=1 Tax=Bacillus inaquosorum TaxID=483913 RepID=UPI00227E19C9|nr:hypothetical protein [Bacillus inaquosorum]MCY9105301.1 hypothetical protein [Bacillus inaquosorum]